jgi:hypothetical protein
MTTTICYDSLPAPRPDLRYEPEHQDGRFYGFVIREAAKGRRLQPDGSFLEVETPVVLAFERVHGRMVFSSDQGSTPEVARRIGLENHASGPLGYRLPDRWLDADPHRGCLVAGQDPAWGEWSGEVE